MSKIAFGSQFLEFVIEIQIHIFCLYKPMATIESHNNMPSQQRMRNFVFTINNPSESDYAAFHTLDASYKIYGDEVGESGTPHMQGYVELNKQTAFSTIKKLLPGAHIEKRRGTAQQAADYCKKDGAFTEVGEISRPGKRNDLEDFLTSAKAEKPSREDLLSSTLYMRYPRHCDAIIDHFHPAQPLESLDNYWIYGETGVGKSFGARQQYGESLYDKAVNKWWDNYRGEDTVLIDDVDTNHKFLGFFLKRWGDHYPFPAEYKGGSRVIRPVRIVVTSNYHPQDIFDDTDVQPILRRFRVVKKLVFPGN